MSKVVNGLTLELQARSESYPATEFPTFDVFVRNVGDQPVVFCDYKALHRFLSTLYSTETGLEMFPFRPTTREPLTAQDFKTIQPGQALRYVLDVPAAARDGYRFVFNGGALPPVKTESMALERVPSGDHIFKVHIGDHISFYLAEPGECGPRERRNILRDLADEASIPAGIWTGDLTALCPVHFSKV